MRIKTGNRIAIGMVMILSVISISAVVYSGYVQNQLFEDSSRLFRATVDIVHFADDVDLVTKISRNYVASLDAYLVDEFSTALADMAARPSPEELYSKATGSTSDEYEIVQRAGRNSEFLIDIERRAVDLARNGRRAEAYGLVFGATFDSYRELFDHSVEHAREQLESRMGARIERRQSEVAKARIVSLASLALTALAVLVQLVFFYNRRVIEPLGRLTLVAKRLFEGDRGVAFEKRNKADAAEIAELEDVLEDYRASMRRLDEQSAETRRLAASQKALLGTVDVGIAQLVDRRIEQCNPKLDELFGTPPGSQLGCSTESWYVSKDDYEYVGREAYPVMWAGETFRHEVLYRRTDGTPFWARLAARAIDPQDRARGIVTAIEDISAEKAAAEAMRAARKLAEEAARVKSDFLANMSHEIRTPMNAIIGMAHLALKASPPPAVRDHLLKIQSSSHLLLGIINDILDISKIEAGKMLIETIDFDLSEVLEGVTALIAEKASAKGLELVSRIAADVPRSLKGDPLRIGQILINFANNAVKFTEKGSVELLVEFAESADRALSDGFAELRFSVRDTGIGLTDEQRGRLFRNFEQADTSTTRQYGGTGLGLAISRRLATLMGGEVGVTSAPGEGSTFWFTGKFALGKGTRKAGASGLDPRGRRVLVADDNADARSVLADMLESMGFAVIRASSGFDAMSVLATQAERGEPVDLMLLDWNMPSMDGIATARKIHELGLGDVSNIVLVTAYGRDELIRAAADAGIVDVLVKPVDETLLYGTLARKLSAAAAATAGLPEDSGFPGARILLVEDNEINREVATEMLSSEGLTVDVAENGRIAVDKVAAVEYDLVLMDVQMPVLDGIAATSEIRRMPSRTGLPIIAMTANAMMEDRERCLAAGMNDHIAKPIDPAVLLETLRHWLKRSARPAMRSAAADSLPGSGVLRNAVVLRNAGAPPDTGILGSLRTLHGLDVATGLHLALDKESLYLSLLRKFADDGLRFHETLDRALASGDERAPERAAHTLKGISAQIGASGLRAAAERLERAFAGGAEPGAVDSARTEVETLLAALSAAIVRAFEAAPAPATAAGDDAGTNGEIDADTCRERCEHLLRLLESSDMEAFDVFEADSALYRRCFGNAYGELSGLIERFDFPAAQERIAAILANPG